MSLGGQSSYLNKSLVQNNVLKSNTLYEDPIKNIIV
jgi:hypothetical protein